MLPFNYNSQIDKKIAFAGYKVIDSTEDFDAWYHSIQYQSSHSKDAFVYRGMYEAAYKNHTSVQRELLKRYFQLGDTRPYVEAQIRELREASCNLIDKYAASLGITCIDLFILSFAQHYGGLSPMMDFTTDLNTALYFMSSKSKTRVDEASDLYDYASIYWSSKSEFTCVEDFLNKIEDNYKPSVEAQHENIHENLTDVCSRLFNYRALSSYVKPTLIENKKYHVKVENQTFDAPVSISNLNIIAQSGCFVFYDPETPIALERPLSCVEINKKLIPYIKSKYLRKMTKGLLFPQGKPIVQKSMMAALRKIGIEE